MLRASRFDFPRSDLDEEAQQELSELRTSGLSLLKSKSKSLISYTLEDEEWLIRDSQKDTKWGYTIWTQLLKRAAWSGDFETADEYMRDNSNKESKHLQDYVDANWEELNSNYDIYTTQWFRNWNSFWLDYTPATKLDLNIFFSLINPKPPDWPKITFFKANYKLNCLQRQTLIPKLIKYIWNNPTLRQDVLKGRPLPPEWEVIVSYSVVWSRITTMHQQKVLGEIYRRKAKGETVKVKLPGGKIINY